MTLGEVLAVLKKKGKGQEKGRLARQCQELKRTQKTLRHLYVEEDNREEKGGAALWSLNNLFVQGTERLLHGGL